MKKLDYFDTTDKLVFQAYDSNKQDCTRDCEDICFHAMYIYVGTVEAIEFLHSLGAEDFKQIDSVGYWRYTTNNYWRSMNDDIRSMNERWDVFNGEFAWWAKGA